MRSLYLILAGLALTWPCGGAVTEAGDAAKMRALVASFRQETLIRLPWPPATSTPASRALVARGNTAVPYVVEGLSSSDPNVRRHSAFVLAQLRPASAYEPLRTAALKEFARVAAAKSEDDPRAVAAPLNMMVVAMSRIDAKKTIEWLVNVNGPGIREVYRELSIVVRSPPVCGNDTTVVCRDRLRRWWQEHQKVVLIDQPWLKN